MKKTIVAVLCLVTLALTLAGCNASLRSLDNVPVGARLVFSHETRYETGAVVTLDSFEASGKSGYFVVEIKLDNGELKGIQLKNETDGNKTIATLGNTMGSVILATENMALDGDSQYSLAFSQMKDFGGEINVYFVPA